MHARILSFLSKLSTDTPPPAIDIHTDLFESGFLDSFGFVELVAFLEKETGHAVTEHDMDDPRFTTVAGMIEVMSEKTNGNARAVAGGSR